MSDKDISALKEQDVSSDGAYYPASEQQMRTYPAAREALSKFQAPVLVHAGNPHERLYVACFDGTGNDAAKAEQPEDATNVARIHDQIAKLENPQISGGYVPGPGTQDNSLANGAKGWRDQLSGGTYEQRIEEMYAKFIDQAWKWKQADPQAEIRLADIGFSRGAEEAAGFARLVHERGIQDPTGVDYKRDEYGLIEGKPVYSKPPLVPPGQVPQVEGLCDAVGTGEPSKHDRRPPPSVISGLHIIAQDERRGTFPSDRIIAPGLTPDGRFLGLTVAGAHADVGGSYRLNGLATRNENMMVDYLNKLSDKPFLEKSKEPDDSRLNVVHRPEKDYKFALLPTVDRSKRSEGYNEWLAPVTMNNTDYAYKHWGGFYTVKDPSGRPTTEDPRHAQPRDESLSSRFERRAVGGVVQQQTQTQTPSTSPEQSSQSNGDLGLQRGLDMRGILSALKRGDSDELDRIANCSAQSPEGQRMTERGNQLLAEQQAPAPAR
jgi:hypothetical protein